MSSSPLCLCHMRSLCCLAESMVVAQRRCECSSKQCSTNSMSRIEQHICTKYHHHVLSLVRQQSSSGGLLCMALHCITGSAICQGGAHCSDARIWWSVLQEGGFPEPCTRRFQRSLRNHTHTRCFASSVASL
jgi:hypothetical protein